MKELPKALLDEIVRRLVEALHPLSIYLFGSHVTGVPDKDSDVDLLVVVPETDVPIREVTRTGRDAVWSLGIPVDLVVCTEGEMRKWSQVPCNLIHTVAEKGRPVYASAR